VTVLRLQHFEKQRSQISVTDDGMQIDANDELQDENARWPSTETRLGLSNGTVESLPQSLKHSSEINSTVEGTQKDPHAEQPENALAPKKEM
jgi:hypothetical protein